MSEHPASREALMAFAHRLTECAQRWERTSNLMIRQGNAQGRDTLEMARKLMALANVARSKRYARLFDADMLAKYAKRGTLEYAECIINTLPDGKIPEYEPWQERKISRPKKG